MPCNGNDTDHCCYVDGKRCPHSTDYDKGRRWSCGLRNKYGSWTRVLASTEYQRDVAPIFDPLGMNCKDWPDGTGGNRGVCASCGVNV